MVQFYLEIPIMGKKNLIIILDKSCHVTMIPLRRNRAIVAKYRTHNLLLETKHFIR